jgi:hypothetical protein
MGINLLGVGLHSYGFTSSLALGFWASVVAISLGVAVLAPIAMLRETVPPAASS